MTLDYAICSRISIPFVPDLKRLLCRVQRSNGSSVNSASCGTADLERQFVELISRESALISKICFSFSCSVAEFDDLRQDALINIWRGMHSFRRESSQRTWIYRITVNSCISTVRRLSRHRHESLDNLYGLIESDDADREAVERMHRAIGSLGAQDRAIIMMWLDEFSYEDIADAIGLNRNTIATKIRRIKDKITKNLKNETI